MDHQAVAQLLGNYGEFAGSIAVFITLAYLAVQVKHGKQATEANIQIAQQNYALGLAQNQIARANLITQQVRSVALSPELAQIFAKFDSGGLDSLSDVERRQFHMWHIAQYYILDLQHYQYTLGLLDEDGWQDAVRRIKVQIEVWDSLHMQIEGRSAFAEEVARIRQAQLDPR